MTHSPINYAGFEQALIATLPPPLRLVFQHYEPLIAENGLVIIVPPDDATRFALSQPRDSPGTAQGIEPGDGIIIIPSNLGEEDIRARVSASEQRHLFLYVTDLDYPDGENGMGPQGLIASIDALPPDAHADLVMSSTSLNDARMDPFRRFLLRQGHVTDLFFDDVGAYVYIGWLKDPELRSEATQVVVVPLPDQWPEFISDLELAAFSLWRWGDLVAHELLRRRPWVHDELQPDLVDVLRRGLEAIWKVDASTSPAQAAYVKIGYLETSLWYLVQLRLGHDADDLWAALRPRTRDRMAERAKSGARLRPEHHLDLSTFPEILSDRWEAFAPAFDPDGSREKSEAMPPINDVLDLRNRVMHPVRLTIQPVTRKEMRRLDEVVKIVTGAVEAAEKIEMDG